MSFYATSDYDCDDDGARQDAERDDLHERYLTDYLSAREAVKRITPGMDRTEVWGIKNRFYLAEVALIAQHDSEAYHDANARAMHGLGQRGAA